MIAMDKKYSVYVLKNADESLAGLSIKGWRIGIAHKTPISADDYLFENVLLFPCIEKYLISSHSIGSMAYLHNGDNPYYIYTIKETDDIYSIKKVINILRLFKSSNIGLSWSFLFNSSCGTIINATPQHVIPDRTYSVPLALTDDEKIKISKLQIPETEQLNGQIQKMLTVFHESFRVENKYLSFILRIMILEMLIEGNAELSYRISRTVAVLLGKNEEESSRIEKICKKMYSARSKYLHDGITNDITQEMQYNALDISRRIIANLAIINTNLPDIRSVLHKSSFGSNPYNVQF